MFKLGRIMPRDYQDRAMMCHPKNKMVIVLKMVTVLHCHYKIIVKRINVIKI